MKPIRLVFPLLATRMKGGEDAKKHICIRSEENRLDAPYFIICTKEYNHWIADEYQKLSHKMENPAKLAAGLVSQYITLEHERANQPNEALRQTGVQSTPESKAETSRIARQNQIISQLRRFVQHRETMETVLVERQREVFNRYQVRFHVYREGVLRASRQFQDCTVPALEEDQTAYNRYVELYSALYDSIRHILEHAENTFSADLIRNDDRLARARSEADNHTLRYNQTETERKESARLKAAVQQAELLAMLDRELQRLEEVS